MDPEPDFEHEIHYALQGESLVWHTRQEKARPICWSMLGYAKMLAVPGLVMLLFVIASAVPPTWASQKVTISLYALLALAVLTPFFIKGRREKRENERLKDQIPWRSDQRYRVRVTGFATRLLRLRELMEAEPDEFEPRIFRVRRPRRPGIGDAAAISLLFLVILAILAGSVLLFKLKAPLLGWFVIYLSLALTLVTWAFLWPTYLRLVPGRLDVLSYGPLGRGTPRVVSFDLKASPLLVLVPGSAVIFYRERGGLQVLRTLEVGPVPGGDEFAFERALLAAAKSSAPAPPLPPDDLIG